MASEEWAAHVEVRRRTEPTADELDELMDALGPFHAAIGMTPRGWLGFRLSVPAEGVRQAALVATALVQAAGPGLVPLSLEVMPEDEWDARQGFVPMTSLIGASQAALMLGVTRQRVIQMVDEGKLPGQLVGRSTVIPRSAVEEWIGRHGPAAT